MGKPHKSFAPPKGMRDFYPEDMLVRSRIFDAWRKAGKQSGFAEYDACVVETQDLLKRKAGEEIVDQIYTFKDKSGRELALRPEMTPTLARMVTAREGSLSFPIKWTTIAQCFRYERMTRGRKREHYQWNLDVVGCDSPAAEAEIIATAVAALAEMGLNREHYLVRFSSRALLGELLNALGIDHDHHAATFLALDKRGKISDEAIEDLLKKEGVDHETASKVFDLLSLHTLEEVSARIPDNSPALTEVEQFLSFAEAYGIRDLLKLNLSVIRGLSYYTGIVFEGFDSRGELRAIFGGGRYDSLLSDLGGSARTAVGMGFGDVVVAELLAETETDNATPVIEAVRVGFMEESQRTTAIQVAAALRRQGRTAHLALTPERAKNFFSQASKTGCNEAIYIGPDDIETGKIRIKNMVTREQREMDVGDL
ncbi:MAG: histidine--tRNA ligase [Kiritimatiellae bacterium]|nr:histidine--tRNA ligase [Kiritimatiellia bacterium]